MIDEKFSAYSRVYVCVTLSGLSRTLPFAVVDVIAGARSSHAVRIVRHIYMQHRWKRNVHATELIALGTTACAARVHGRRSETVSGRR